ncbi:transposase [Streptomyces sp. NPDC001812]|uniref:Transposase n=1 Tax=Streptomyces cathayae TaxID=3031124 RepID=A0ABY8K8J0_9ACTN|nr:transposase [Streptomyces sp. HUAS 5]WGD44584.1 transposase [Streptomyces sp. HUAS 5]
MDWKFLLGLEPDDPGFDFSALSDFRARLIKHGLEEKVLAPVLERISALGLLRAALEALAAAAPRWLSPGSFLPRERGRNGGPVALPRVLPARTRRRPAS